MQTPRRRKLRRLSQQIIAAQKPIRVIASIGWPQGEKTRFLERRTPQLPKVEYASLPFDPRERDRLFREICNACDRGDPLQRILYETSRQYRRVIALLQARGQPAFVRHSRLLYGSPTEPFVAGGPSSLDLAQHAVAMLDAAAYRPLLDARQASLSARQVAGTLRRRFDRFFGAGRVSVAVSARLTADAAAGAARLRIRRDGLFTRATVDYLEQHEGYVHIATSLNGSAQPVLPVLGKATPRSVRYNEGLAVFGEWASGTLTASRLRKLAERIELVHMADQGADFLDLYRQALERGHSREHAYDIAHRVFRGGLPAGGAHYTKDACYLDYFVRVFNFARTAVLRGRPDLLELFFAGKVTLEDLPALAEARSENLVIEPRHLPPWLRAADWLTAHLALSSFFNQLDMSAIGAAHDALFAGCAWPDPGRESFSARSRRADDLVRSSDRAGTCRASPANPQTEK